MRATFRLPDYQIRIGNEDIIERHLHGILSADRENSESQEKAQKALDELLLEKTLIYKANDERKGKKAPAWTDLIYMIASALFRKDFSFDARSKLSQSTGEKDIPAIAVYLEAFLSQLHTWLAGMLDGTETLKLTGGSELSIVKSDLARLNQRDNWLLDDSR